jgi:transposase
MRTSATSRPQLLCTPAASRHITICSVDGEGQVVLETTVVSDPEAIRDALKPYLGRLRRVGHEAGALSPWLHPKLLKLGLPAVCLETQHVRAALKAQRNKTDAADALGIAHIMRTGWFRKAHIKSEACYRLRLLLTHRRNLKRKFLDIEERDPALAQGVRHPFEPHRARRFCASRWPAMRWSAS